MELHSALWWKWENINQTLASQKTLSTLPLSASYEVFMVRILEEIDRAIMASHCTCSAFWSICSVTWREWGLWLGDNDRAARVLFVQHPREQGEWCSQNPSVARVLT